MPLAQGIGKTHQMSNNRSVGKSHRSAQKPSEMTSYTFYVLGFDGYLMGGTAIRCSNDAEAIHNAEKLLGTFNASVEVWDGSRKVGRADR